MFQRMVSALGGPSDLIERPTRHLMSAPIVRPVPALAEGYVMAIDSRALGVAVVTMGGGRTRAADPIDHAVGLTDCLQIGAHGCGDMVRRGDALAMVHARSDAQAEAAAAAVQSAYTLGPEFIPASPAVVEWSEGA
jgi:thymidine phosphorylase